MPNTIKGEVALKLNDGREFVLVGGFDAMIEAESLYGKPAQQIAADAQAGFIGAIRALFYGMLKRKHPSITPADASDLLGEHMPEIEAAMTAVSQAANPPEGKEGGNPRPKPTPSRPGKSSGRNGVKPA